VAHDDSPPGFNELFVDLFAVPRMNETRLKHLLARFETPERVLGAGASELAEVPKVDAELAQAIAGYQRSPETDERVRRAREAGVWTCGYSEPGYPEPLRELAHMPPVLFGRGRLLGSDRLAVAVVGTRVPTHYGRQVAEKLGRELGERGVTVVSGLARGIDTAAHRGALAASGRTVAVLGCGIDVHYPPENRRLYDEIAAAGAVLTEYPPGAEPMAMNFPRRNRVVSGLSRAVVAVEAGEKSGVLNTVEWAQEQGRAVYAVPGNITSAQSAGTNRLLGDGARALGSVEGLLRDLGVSAAAPERPRAEVSEAERPVFDFLTAEPVHVDDLCEGLGMPVGPLLSVLLGLELKGLVRQLPGKLFAKVF
jgi:DNA processing protein